MTHRLGAVALLLIAVAVTAFTFGGARPASAEGTPSPGHYLVMEVPGDVVDDLVAVKRGAARSGGWISGLPNEIALALCTTFPELFECVCVGPEPCTDAQASPPGFAEPELSYTLCGTYECLCIDVDPEACVPDRDRLGGDRIALESSLRMPDVLDRMGRELRSGMYSAVKLCSTHQQLYVGCVEARLPQA